MKNKFILTIFWFSLFSLTLQAQPQLPVLGILNVKASGIIYSNEQTGELLRLEFEKTNKYDVLQREDAKSILEKAGLNIDSIYSRDGLISAGRTLNASYMVSGFVARFGDKIIVKLSLINVATGFVEKTSAIDFLNLQSELQQMFQVSISKLLDQPYNNDLFTRLTTKTYDNKTNNPGAGKLVLTGPRIGIMCLTGIEAKRMKADEAEGGYELNRPFMSVFGYQKEIQYINEGNFQALLEILPMVTGLDAGRFIPSITFMNGFRNNRNGWEFALGPSISLTRTTRGFYFNDKFYRDFERNDPVKNTPANPKMITVIDRRGDPSFSYAFVFSVGKTIKSGQMNLPLNAFTSFSKQNFRFGFSFGFNSKNKVAPEKPAEF